MSACGSRGRGHARLHGLRDVRSAVAVGGAEVAVAAAPASCQRLLQVLRPRQRASGCLRPVRARARACLPGLQRPRCFAQMLKWVMTDFYSGSVMILYACEYHHLSFHRSTIADDYRKY